MAAAATPAKRSVHHAVVETMVGRILSGEYGEGAILPGHDDLAIELGASRTVLREAMRVLSAKGFVDARKRAGTRVRPRSDWSLLDRDVLRWLFAGGAAVDVSDNLLVLRRIIEPEAAALAAQNASGRDIAAMEAAFERMRKSVPDDLDEYVRADVDFHVALLTASANMFLQQLAHAIGTALLVTFQLSTRLADLHAEAISLHGELVEHVRARDAARARTDVIRLLSVAERHLHPDDARRALRLGDSRQPAAKRAKSGSRLGRPPRQTEDQS